jgi:hypothetical protein
VTPKRHKPRTSRPTYDAVTGEKGKIPLTPVRLAFERVCHSIDRELQPLKAEADGATLVALIRDYLKRCVRHTDKELLQ